VHAVIIPAAGEAVPPDEVIAWCHGRLAGYKCPKSVEFATTLPRTTTGKVLKRELRAQLAARPQTTEQVRP
jgi:long-chain acyl-CoA synthetase